MTTQQTPFALVGWGYRSRAWLDAAQGIGLPCVGVVVRSPRETPVPSLSDVAAARDAGAHFLVSSVSRASTPEVTRQSVALGLATIPNP